MTVSLYNLCYQCSCGNFLGHNCHLRGAAWCDRARCGVMYPSVASFVTGADVEDGVRARVCLGEGELGESGVSL